MSAAASPSKSTPLHIPSLDGIRAFSFLVVFVAHAGLGNIVPGGFGVTVFFFLSGYLITTLMRLEWDAYGAISLKQFYLRRVLRILPPFYIVLTLATGAAALGFLHGELRLAAVLAQVLHCANYWSIAHGFAGQAPGTAVYWSLAVEEHFYFVFPLVFIALRRNVRARAREAVVLYAICAAILLWRCVLVHGFHVTENRTYLASDTRVDSILFGCALAAYGNPVLDGRSRFSDAAWKWLLFPLGLAGLTFSLVYRNPSFRETFRYSLQGLALTPVFVTAIRFPSWGPFRILNTRIASFLGVLSYSLYLVHHAILDAVAVHVRASVFAQGTLALAFSIALAWTIYQLVEKPCARLRKRLARAPA